MSGDLNFDANQVAPASGFEPLPVGQYSAIVTDSIWKATRNNDGRYLQLTIQVIEGEYANRKLWDRLNLENKSAEAVKIARATLSALCRAVGVMTPQNASELHNKPFVVSVGMEKGMNEGEMQNKIKGYRAPQGAPHSSAGQAASVGATAPAASSAPARAPWSK